MHEIHPDALARVTGGVSEAAPPGGGSTVTPPMGTPDTAIRDVNQLLGLRRWDAKLGSGK